MGKVSQDKSGSITITERASLLRICIEIAADKFRDNAAELRTDKRMARLAEQFDRQEREARELLQYFCEGDAVQLTFIA